MQSEPDRDKLKLHEYAPGTPVGPPDRVILSKYGHSLEISEDRVILTTSEGYQLLLENHTGETGGSASMQTNEGQRLTLNDTNQTAVLQAKETAVMSATTTIMSASTDVLVRAGASCNMLIGGSSLLMRNDGTVSICTARGGSVLISPDGDVAIISGGGASVAVEGTVVQVNSPTGTAIIVDDGKISINAPQIVINTSAMAVGVDAQYPAVMLTPSFRAWVAAVNSHTHAVASSVAVVAPQIAASAPIFPDDSGSGRMSLT